ncbi:MAG: cation diffusion facilitator family transporter [Dethiobacteria bacterium]|jgi:cation diffusion facilitator family transporter
MDCQMRTKIGNRVAMSTIIANIFLSALKLTAGHLGSSNAMIADALHSLSDVVTTIAVVIGLNLANKPADEDHPYGHEKFEPVVGKVLAIILMLSAMGIGYKGVQSIFIGSYQTPGRIALYAAILSIIIKEWMYRYTIKTSKKIGSTALAADAWHHRSDAYSSVGALAAILGARLGFKMLDAIAAIIISFAIMKVSLSIFIKSVNRLVDFSADRDTVESIRKDILSVEGVIEINNLKTRLHANKLFVDLEVAVDGSIPVHQGHEIAQKVHDLIESNYAIVKHCMVHVEPHDTANIMDEENLSRLS